MDQTVVLFPSSNLDVKPRRIKPSDYLDSIEATIVRAYLRNAPQADEPPQDWYADDEQRVRLRHIDESGMGNVEVRNAVARICLNSRQCRLPQWAMVRNGEVTLARSYDTRRGVGLELAPQFLFMLNWADSGPGFSWPESYHATFLPGFNRWVVTMSVDSTDVWGCTDLAIGSFPAGSNIVRSSGRIIITYWRKYQCYDPDAGGWAYLFETGIVDEAVAYRWRRRVWSRTE